MQLNKQSGTSVAGNVVTSLTTKDTQLKTLLYGQVSLTTDATVADRRVVVSLKDGDGNVVIDLHAGAVVAASQTSQHHEFLQGIYRETSFAGGALQVPMPNDFVIPPGYSVNISVENGVAGDSYNYSLMSKVEHVVPDETMVE